MVEVTPKVRKKIYNTYLKEFLSPEIHEIIQKEDYVIKIDLQKLTKTKELQNYDAWLVGHDTGEVGRFGNAFVKVKLILAHKKEKDYDPNNPKVEDIIENIFLKAPIRSEDSRSVEHIQSNLRYNVEAKKDGFKLLPLYGSGGYPKFHIFSEYGGKSLGELNPEEKIQDAAILAYALGASVETLDEVFGDYWKKGLNTKAPAEHRVLDTLVKFPDDDYLPSPELESALIELRDIVNSKKENGVEELIKKAEKLNGEDKKKVEELIRKIKFTEEVRNDEPYKDSAGVLKDYEGAIKAVLERRFNETAHRIERIKETYKQIEKELKEKLWDLKEFDEEETETFKLLKEHLKAVQQTLDVVLKNDEKAFLRLKEKYKDIFDNPLRPTICAPSDVTVYNLRLKKEKKKNGNGKEKTIGFVYLIDQWLPEGKNFIYLRDSPASIYFILKNVVEAAQDQLEVKVLIENICKALEIEYIGTDERPPKNECLTKEELEALEEIIANWYYWVKRRAQARTDYEKYISYITETESIQPTAKAEKGKTNSLEKFIPSEEDTEEEPKPPSEDSSEE